MKVFNFDNRVFENPDLLIHDWYTLAVRTGVYPRSLAHASKNKHNLVRRIQIREGRVVYESSGSLRVTQNGLRSLFIKLQSDPRMDHIWSYKKGVNVRSKVKELEQSQWIVHFDIRKFFDHIEYRHIVETLKHLGYSAPGARLISKYATVQTRHNKFTLQQGSPVSGELSNLVGYYYFDRHILTMLKALNDEYPSLVYQYVRYCDNVYLAIKSPETPFEAIKKYKDECNKIVNAAGFSAHKWATVPNNHPKQNQKVLGIIVNAEARIETQEFERVRATLFNACSYGMEATINDYYDKHPTNIFEEYARHTKVHAQTLKFFQVMKGKISYIDSISEKQGKQLAKLLGAAAFLNESRDFSIRGVGNLLPEEVFNVLKSYSKRSEGVTEFLDRLKNAVK